MFKKENYITSKDLESNGLKLGRIVSESFGDTVVYVIDHNDLFIIGRNNVYSTYSMDDTFKIVNLTKPKKMYMCACCHNKVEEPNILKASNGTYICNKCYEIGGRGYENNNPFHNPVKSNKTYGFEFECVPKSKEDYLSMLLGRYHLLPTFDCTLPYNGVELKSPMYHGLNGLKKLFTTFDKYVDFSDSKCGQHISIGDTKYINIESIRTLRSHVDIFDILYKYMESHSKDTTRVCGRYFTRWAQLADYQRHSSWICLQYDNRVEFRLSKFTSPEQYYALTCMWTEILDCAIDNIIKDTSKSSNNVGNLMIEIFKKYANDQAKCQHH